MCWFSDLVDSLDHIYGKMPSYLNGMSDIVHKKMYKILVHGITFISIY